MASITLHAQTGSLGGAIAHKLADILGLNLLTLKDLLAALAGEVPANILKLLSESPKAFLTQAPFGCSFLEYFEGSLNERARREDFLLLNFGGAQFLRDEASVMHVKVVASLPERTGRLMAREGWNEEKAQREILLEDRRYQRYLNTLFGLESEVEGTYDLILSTDRASLNGAVRLIRDLYEDLRAKLAILQSEADSAAQVTMAEVPELKNASELDFAHMLDMYHIDWRYEPKTFPIEWDEQGRVTLAFSPDFYLPKFNLYLELTTMNQKYVTMKNKKAKKLRELYPGVNVRIVYKKDFASMMERFAEA